MLTAASGQDCDEVDHLPIGQTHDAVDVRYPSGPSPSDWRETVRQHLALHSSGEARPERSIRRTRLLDGFESARRCPTSITGQLHEQLTPPEFSI